MRERRVDSIKSRSSVSKSLSTVITCSVSWFLSDYCMSLCAMWHLKIEFKHRVGSFLVTERFSKKKYKWIVKCISERSYLFTVSTWIKCFLRVELTVEMCWQSNESQVQSAKRTGGNWFVSFRSFHLPHWWVNDSLAFLFSHSTHWTLLLILLHCILQEFFFRLYFNIDFNSKANAISIFNAHFGTFYFILSLYWVLRIMRKLARSYWYWLSSPSP